MYLAKTYARTGKTAEATKLVKDMVSKEQSPTAMAGINRSGHTDEAAINVAKGEVALATGNAPKAIEAFEVADKLVPHSHGMESLAFGLRVTGKPQEAARVYQELLDNMQLGAEGQESWVLAHYELGKIYQDLGDKARALESYRKFLDLWKDADEDIPVLRQAKAAAAKLQN
jgi:tetratricopeptide (TPR) repeat protein